MKIAINSKNFEQVFGEKINYTTKEESKISPDAVAPVDFVNLKSMAAGNSVANVIIRDSEATTLGTAESESRFAIKQFPEWTSVYSASCEMPSQILRFIAKKAGCHIYNETGNVVFNRGNFVAVHVAHSGDIKIKFPGNETVVDVFGKTVIQPENCQITFRAEKGQTKLFVQDRNPDDLLKKISEKTKQSEKNRQEYSKKYPAPQPSPGYLQGIRYGRRPNQKFAGNIGFNRNNPFIPRVMLVSGPYDKDAELDLTKFEKAAKSAKYAPLPKVSLSLEDLWQPLERMANCKPEDPVIWTPYWTGDIWTMMNRFGIGKGQKGVFSFYLVAKEEKEVEIYLASDGKATLLMDEKLLQAKPGRLGTIVKLPVGKTQIRIVAENISGNDGFTIKIGEKVPKKGHARITANPKNVSVSILP